MNKEQTEKLWKWCGFKVITNHCGTRDTSGNLADGLCLTVQDPDGNDCGSYPEVTLDTLFRWAVPKLVGFYDVSFGKISKEDTYGCVLRLITMTNGELGLKNYTGKSIDPAEALALAILEVIDGH
jgi:hypothetical protein